MTKDKKITLQLTPEQANAVMLSLIESQEGYTFGSAIPQRIVNLRDVIVNLQKEI